MPPIPIQPPELFDEDTFTPPTLTAAEREKLAADVRAVRELLPSLPGPITPSRVARALGWDSERAEEALMEVGR